MLTTTGTSPNHRYSKDKPNLEEVEELPLPHADGGCSTPTKLASKPLAVPHLNLLGMINSPGKRLLSTCGLTML